VPLDVASERLAVAGTATQGLAMPMSLFGASEAANRQNTQPLMVRLRPACRGVIVSLDGGLLASHTTALQLLSSNFIPRRENDMNSRLAGMQLAVVMMVSLYAASPVAANDVDMAALTQETQKISQKADEMTLVWWIPEEFWKVSLAQQKRLLAEQADDFLKVMRPYVVVVVVKGKIGFSSTFESEEFMRANTKVIDSQGNACAPLSDADVDAMAKAVLGMFKPMFSNTMGALGKNMHVLVFSAKTVDGRKVIDTKQKGQFKVTLANKEFKWRLPFDSVLPKQTCLKCQEDCKGSWMFCPWCGGKLTK
jgi:hypothetical protein